MEAYGGAPAPAVPPSVVVSVAAAAAAAPTAAQHPYGGGPVPYYRRYHGRGGGGGGGGGDPAAAAAYYGGGAMREEWRDRRRAGDRLDMVGGWRGNYPVHHGGPLHAGFRSGRGGGGVYGRENNTPAAAAAAAAAAVAAASMVPSLPLNLTGDRVFLNKITFPTSLPPPPGVSDSASGDGSSSSSSASASTSSPSHRWDPVPPRKLHVVSFSELVDLPGRVRGESVLERVFATTYIWESSFILEHFPRDVPFALACHWAPPKMSGVFTIRLCELHGLGKCACAERARARARDAAAVAAAGSVGAAVAPIREIALIHPPFPEGIDGNVHSKLLVLCFRTHLRLIVSSANLQRRDWDAMSQTVWFQDFPRRESAAAAAPKLVHRAAVFRETLHRFLAAFGLDPEEYLGPYSFAQATGADLVASLPGVHTFASRSETSGEGDGRGILLGHMRLRELVLRTMGPHRGSQQHTPPPYFALDYQTASIGALRTEWMKEFISSAVAAQETHEPLVDCDLRVVFPTHEEVASARYVAGARTVCYWDKSGTTLGFLHHPYHPLRRRLLLHSKVVVGRRILSLGFGASDGPVYDEEGPCWAYCGSHNFSSSAWGRTSPDGLQVNNYEMGVFLAPGNTAALRELSLPFVLDCRGYGPSDRPWLIPVKNRCAVQEGSPLRIHLYVLLQKHALLPPPDEIAALTGAAMVLPPETCASLLDFGVCEYGDYCRFSHALFPVELEGPAKSVMEATRLVVQALTPKSFSMGATIFLSPQVAVPGWVWRVAGSRAHPVFVPDASHPLAPLVNIDVMFLPPALCERIRRRLADLNFLSGTGLWLVERAAVRPGGGGAADAGLPEGCTAVLYLFGSRPATQQAAQDVHLLRNPSDPDDDDDDDDETHPGGGSSAAETEDELAV